MIDLSAFVIDGSMKMNRAIGKNIVHTYGRGTVGPHHGVKALAEAIDVANPRHIDTVNNKILKEMLSRTRNSVAQISAQAKHYREGEGRMTGGLGRAVNSSKFGYADAHGIYFANVTVLNQEAKHWGRLNFGTKGGATITPNGVFRLRFNERIIGPPVGFRDQPRAAFYLPGGGFYDGAGDFSSPKREFRGMSTGNVFQPGAVTLVKTVTRGGPGPKKTVRIKKRLPTVGIKSRHFLDAGLRGLEARFPIEYEAYIKKQLEDGSEAGIAAAKALKPGFLT